MLSLLCTWNKPFLIPIYFVILNIFKLSHTVFYETTKKKETLNCDVAVVTSCTLVEKIFYNWAKLSILTSQSWYVYKIQT